MSRPRAQGTGLSWDVALGLIGQSRQFNPCQEREVGKRRGLKTEQQCLGEEKPAKGIEKLLAEQLGERRGQTAPSREWSAGGLMQDGQAGRAPHRAYWVLGMESWVS